MKKITMIIFVLCMYNQLHANYTGSININPGDLQYSVIDSFNLVSIQGFTYIYNAGAPKLPAKYLQFIIPHDKRVAQIIINEETGIDIEGTFNIYPAQAIQCMSAPLNPSTVSDTSIYNHNQFYPSSCFSSGRTGNLNGAKILFFRKLFYLYL